MKIWDFDAKMIFNVLDNATDVSKRISALSIKDYTENNNNYPGVRITDGELFKDVSFRMQRAITQAYPEIYDITDFECCLQRQSESEDYQGGIHTDPYALVAVLYMDKVSQRGQGTVLYHNNYDRLPPDHKKVSQTYQGLCDPHDYVSKYNDKFRGRDYVTFESRFNSMSVFPGHVMHGRNKNCLTPPRTRNFFVGFVKRCRCKWSESM